MGFFLLKHCFRLTEPPGGWYLRLLREQWRTSKGEKWKMMKQHSVGNCIYGSTNTWELCIGMPDALKKVCRFQQILQQITLSSFMLGLTSDASFQICLQNIVLVIPGIFRLGRYCHSRSSSPTSTFPNFSFSLGNRINSDLLGDRIEWNDTSMRTMQIF